MAFKFTPFYQVNQNEINEAIAILVKEAVEYKITQEQNGVFKDTKIILDGSSFHFNSNLETTQVLIVLSVDYFNENNINLFNKTMDDSTQRFWQVVNLNISIPKTDDDQYKLNEIAFYLIQALCQNTQEDFQLWQTTLTAPFSNTTYKSNLTNNKLLNHSRSFNDDLSSINLQILFNIHI